ncbi:MAG TPA: helix-turn-helix transcriptional regulator [Abditibacteriaceae bacterium]|jgi:transcriptional regulator with XRE-family HTH domain
MKYTGENLSAAERFNQLIERRKQTDTYWVELAKDDVANEIFDLMAQQKITKAQLAKKMGVSRVYIGKVLQGGANLTIETMVKIGLALGYHLRRDCFYVPAEIEQTSSLPGDKDTSKRLPPEVAAWIVGNTYQDQSMVADANDLLIQVFKANASDAQKGSTVSEDAPNSVSSEPERLALAA